MPDEGDEADIMAGDRRIARPDTALPDWHMPDAAYRPVPIAWFTAAFLLQAVMLTFLFVVLLAKPAWVTIVLSAAATGVLGAWTWDRGMKAAGTGWQVATATMFVLQLGFVCLGAAARG
ncbi:hypothetical protein [Erythrobacter sp. CCH5-A1]|jgi:hypothetical protein|uniref:hypothetical protein n=1 Tax=Erythrobacter sp. CCH5-A1 TaxID=1768792 RepID=UPI0008316B16|nr:hypothetical protein [Erythrobacter sp. CCH5-A1]